MINLKRKELSLFLFIAEADAVRFDCKPHKYGYVGIIYTFHVMCIELNKRQTGVKKTHTWREGERQSTVKQIRAINR